VCLVEAAADVGGKDVENRGAVVGGGSSGRGGGGGGGGRSGGWEGGKVEDGLFG